MTVEGGAPVGVTSALHSCSEATVSSPLKAISTFPDDALLDGVVTTVDGAVALTSVPVADLMRQGFKLGEPRTVNIDGRERVGVYVGTLLPSAIDTLFGPGNLEDAEIAVAMAFDNRKRLTAVELVTLDGSELPSVPFALTRGEIARRVRRGRAQQRQPGQPLRRGDGRRRRLRGARGAL